MNNDYTSHYYITKYFSIKEGIKESHHINNIQIPEKLTKFCKLPVPTEYENREIYFYRNFIESKDIYNSDFREKIKESKNKAKEYFDKKNMEFIYGTHMKNNLPDDENKENILKETENKINEDNNINRKILIEREIPDVKFDYDKIRKKIHISKDFIILLENESDLFNINEFVEKKENKKIKEDKNFRIYPLNLRETSKDEIEAIIRENKEVKFDNKRRTSIILKRQNLIENSNQKEIKFCPYYFDSEKGKEYHKEHPHEKYVDNQNKNNNVNENENEIDPQRLLDKAREEYKENPLINNNNSNTNLNLENNIDDNINNKQNSPVVYLNENNNIISNKNKQFKDGKKRLPSLYSQQKILAKINDEYNQQKSKEWAESKSIKYTVDGNLRTNNPLVPHYIKPTFPQAEFNEDYIYIDKLTERRVKTSSVSNRIYFNAPSIEEIRKSGQHDILMEALENRRTPDEMMERLNLMITSELCDPLNKQLKIDPVAIDFGVCNQGKNYQMFFNLRNDDNMTNRVLIRKSASNNNNNNINNKNYIGIESFIGGKVVPGETKRVKIVLFCSKLNLGKFNDIIEVTTKSFIYKIPIKAFIVKESEYDENKYYMKGRELYKKSYIKNDSKNKYDPVKIVLPKIKELEEKEKKKKIESKKRNSFIDDNNNNNNNNLNDDESADAAEENNNNNLPPV